MAEQNNSGFSNLLGQSGVVNYPLLGLLPNIYSRGMDYQSRLTPYRRSARGDWARAINEGINQYFAQLPQYYSQVRANQLTQQQLAQNKIKQERDTQLFNLKMQELERAKKIRENYPKTVQSLPIADEAKKYLLTLPPSQGSQVMQSLMTEYYKSQFKAPEPKGRPLTDAELKEGGFPKGTFLKPDGTYGFPNEATIKFMTEGGSGGDEVSSFIKNYAGQNNSYSKVKSITQLPGEKTEEKQFNALALLPEGHPTRVQAERDLASKSFKVGNNFAFLPKVGRGGVNPQGTVGSGNQNARITSIDVPEGEFLSTLADKYRKQGYPVSEDILFALNPEHFEIGADGKPDRNRLKTYTQTNLPFKILESDSNLTLNPNDISNIQSKGGKTGLFETPVGTVITNKTLSSEQFIKLNGEYNNAKVFSDSIEDLLVAVTRPEAMTPTGLTANAGTVQALHRRIMRIQQTLSNMGVLSPGEIPFLLKTVPDYQTFTSWLLKTAGRKEFIDAVYQELRKDAMTQMQNVEQIMMKYGERPIARQRASVIQDFPIPGLQPGSKGKRAGL